MFRNSLQELPSDDPFQIKDDEKVGVLEKGGGGGEQGEVGVSEKGGGWVGAVARGSGV